MSNRIHQIQTITPECCWQHVLSADNPADCASRGLLPSELPNQDLYWRGPHFIHDSPDGWGSDIDRLSYLELPEVRPVCLVVQISKSLTEWFIRFSSYDRAFRVTALMRRFVAKCLRLPMGSTLVLTCDEIDTALRIIVLDSQRFPLADLRKEPACKARVSS